MLEVFFPSMLSCLCYYFQGWKTSDKTHVSLFLCLIELRNVASSENGSCNLFVLMLPLWYSVMKSLSKWIPIKCRDNQHCWNWSMNCGETFLWKNVIKMAIGISFIIKERGRRQNWIRGPKSVCFMSGGCCTLGLVSLKKREAYSRQS